MLIELATKTVGYTTADVIYRWNKERPAVAIAEDMKLSQFDLVDCPAGNMTVIVYKAAAPIYTTTTTTSSITTTTTTTTTNDYYNYPYGKANFYNLFLNNNNNNKYGNLLKTFGRNQRLRSASGLQMDKGFFSGKTFGREFDSTTDEVSSGRIKSNHPSEYSMLMVNFHLQRHMGNFLIQVYGPCCLLVVLSWVSFWLNREATADRVSLGITTVLTMTFLGLEARTDLPKVPYPTALDFFVFLSFAFIFATILQFAVVHYFTKYGSGECYFIIEEMESDSDAELPATELESKIYEVIPLTMCSISIPTPGQAATTTTSSCLRRPRLKRNRAEETDASWFHWFSNCGRKQTARVNFDLSNEDDEHVHLRAGEGEFQPTPIQAELSKLFTDVPSKHSSGRRRMSYYRREELEARRKGKRTPQYNSVSKIDRASRIVFPVLFILINVFYWYSYLSRSSRILSPINTAT